MSTLDSSKDIGSSVESTVIDSDPGIRYVRDSVASWYDALAVEVLEPTLDRPFYGLCLVEPGTEVEIKGAAVVRSNGSYDRPGHWYIKRNAHERLLDAGGVYLLSVYGLRPETPILSSCVIPASLLDEVLSGSWYSVDADRSEDEVVQLTWSRLIDREDVPGVEEVDRP